ncbi:site-2 protease family protein [Streptomyces pacificus]|uniref:Zinc metalloprotease n=1 Tax=Streptomyces pacificus TaxID=2705029 RepID=A0A6A0ANN1_9ACTN|nr:site-2 protease family protein [Streptomyces pacificus]
MPLSVHWTVPLLIVLFGYSLGSQTLPAWTPGRSATAYTVAGLAGAMLLLLSLLAHETAHALTARRKGIPVHDVTLWALGGVTRMDRPSAPGAAFLVAVSGPLTSLAVGGAALGAGMGLAAGPGWAVPTAVLLWLGWVNLLVAVFNLLPAAPLDGGRVVQALMWWRTGDRERAERAAGRGGQILGILLIAVGWLAVLRGSWSGLWLAVLGFFVVVVANAERRQASLTTALGGVRASDIMAGPVETAPDWITVQRYFDDPSGPSGPSGLSAHGRHAAVPLLDFEGRPSGLLQLPGLSAIPAARRDTLRLRDVAVPLSLCTTCAPDDLLEKVVRDIRPRSAGLPILVVDGGRLVGVITAGDIDRLAQRRTLRGDGTA